MKQQNKRCLDTETRLCRHPMATERWNVLKQIGQLEFWSDLLNDCIEAEQLTGDWVEDKKSTLIHNYRCARMTVLIWVLQDADAQPISTYNIQMYADGFHSQIEKRLTQLNAKLKNTGATPQSEDHQQITAEIRRYKEMLHEYEQYLEKEAKFDVYHAISAVLTLSTLSGKDTVVRQKLNTMPKEESEAFKILKSVLVDSKDETQTLKSIVETKASKIRMVMAQPHIQQCLKKLQNLNGKTYEDIKQEIVMEQLYESSEEEGKVLKQKKNLADKKDEQQEYDGDEEIVTGDSDFKGDSQGDVKKKKIMAKKKAKKKYVEEQDYYASQEEQKHKKSHAINWKFKGDQQYDTDKQKAEQKKTSKPAG